MIERLLSGALEERFKQEDLEDCYVVDISVGPHDRFTVYIDSDSHFSLGRCKTVSRYLERLIEENNWAGEKYVLEVSSPGLDRPLKLKRQYNKNLGRRLVIQTNEGEKFEGLLTAVDDDVITVKIDDKIEKQLNFNEIDKAKVLASFK